MFPRNNHRIIFEYIKERTDSFALCAQNDRLFSRCERRKARGNPFFLFRGITDSFTLRVQNDRLFSHCKAVQTAVAIRFPLSNSYKQKKTA